MSSAFVSKSRRVRFQLHLRILDLNNVPLVTGQSFVKWHLPSSKAAEHRGRTPKCPIKEHRVLYDYQKTVAVRLTVGKDGMLQECSVHLEVVQEYSAGGKPERIRLGWVRLNLAEYVEASEGMSPLSPTGGTGGGQHGHARHVGEEELGVVRRYLMQDSKLNSTLKLGVYMRHIEGTRDYYAPPLRTAPVFGGIAGIISSSDPAASATHGVAAVADGESIPHGPTDLPSLSATSRETGEMQDMYRRTLVAFWASQPGELKADECVEDIFAGGDGWGKGGRPQAATAALLDSSQPGSGTSTPNPDGEHESRTHHKRSASGVTGKGMMALGAREKYGKHGHKLKVPKKGAGEVDEFDIRNDLKSWQVGATV